MGHKSFKVSSVCGYRKAVLYLGAYLLPLSATLSRTFFASSSRRGDIAHGDVTPGDRLPPKFVHPAPSKLQVIQLHENVFCTVRLGLVPRTTK